MNKIIDICKDKLNLPTIIVIIAVVIGIINLYSYLFPFTDNAFVVANNQTVAADVSGYVSEIYVKNGEKVTKGTPLFKVFDKPYQLAVAKSQANYEEALAACDEQRQATAKNQQTLQEAEANLAKANYEYKLKSNPSVSNSVSELEIKQAMYTVKSLTGQVNALKTQLRMDEKALVQKEKKVEAAKASLASDEVNLEETVVKAGADGVIDNMYLAIGTPVNAHQALFSLVNTGEWFIQANMYETDLRKVRPGDKAIIVMRMYYFDKIFHGVIVNNLWVTDRQTINSRTQQQTVASDNEWLNLPQRVPLSIKVIDPDPKYPLNPGTSAYVYIQTK